MTHSFPSRPPFLSMRWLDLLFAHWPLEPAVLRPLIPAGLELDTFDGSAWLGVVPFRMTHVRPFALPLPGEAFAFAETNVRTYATAPDGTRGIWFLSLDGAQLAGATAARVAFGVPYHHAGVTSRIDGDWIVHASRCTQAAPAELRIRYRPIGPVRHARARWPRGVPHRPHGPVRGPPWPADGDAGRARRLAAPGRRGRDRAQHDGLAVRDRAAPDPADPAVRPPPGHRRAPSDDPRRRSVARRFGPSTPHAPRLRSRHAARDDRPRPGRALGARLRPPARAHADRPVARPGPLGLLGAHPRRAGDPRGARALPRGRRRRAGRPHDARRRARPRVAQADLRAQRAAPGDGRRLVPRPPTTRRRR